jgi:PAS domain S-box-containing protein
MSQDAPGEKPDLEARLRASEAANAALSARLADAQAVLDAIREGEVDAVVANGSEGPQVFTLVGADHPYRVMVECMSDGAATLLADGSLAYANQRFADLLQLPLERLTGCALIDFIEPADRERFREACAAARTQAQRQEISLRAADGSVLPARIAMSPVAGRSASAGGVDALCLVVSDLTESHQRQELEIAWSAARASEHRLRLADRQKDEFLAMLAHELRNPLAPIRTVGELLSRLLKGQAQLQAPLAMLARQTQQLTRLVDDLLDISRIAQGRIVLKQEPVEMGAVIDQAAETVQPLISEKTHRLRVHKPLEALYVHGDRARLVQSVGNLLHNAAKYTDAGGLIQIEVQHSPSEIRLSVCDNGSGIAPELLTNVFDLFVQGERTLDRAQGGLGVGLSVVKRLIDMHHGEVGAASPGLGQGATFTITLPRVSAPRHAPDQPACANPGVRRILVVDDNADAANALAMLLRSDGHEAQAVYSARAAIEAAERLRPEFVLLDLGLPEMDGFEVARQLTARPSLGKVKLIALSGYASEEVRERTAAAGFMHHLAKPTSVEELHLILSR